MMTREKARELFMQMIFQMDAQNDYTENAKEIFLRSFPIDGKGEKYFNEMYTVVSGNLDKIDSIIDKSSSNWKSSRMAKVDLAICRVSVAEMMFKQDIPDAVSINEAINLAKKFGTESSQKFVNGLLGKAVSIKDEQ